MQLVKAADNSLLPGVVKVTCLPPDTTREALWTMFEKFGIETLELLAARAEATLTFRDRSVETVNLVISACQRAPFLSGALVLSPVTRGRPTRSAAGGRK